VCVVIFIHINIYIVPIYRLQNGMGAHKPTALFLYTDLKKAAGPESEELRRVRKKKHSKKNDITPRFPRRETEYERHETTRQKISSTKKTYFLFHSSPPPFSFLSRPISPFQQYVTRVNKSCWTKTCHGANW
jgi:hypothetical protein